MVDASVPDIALEPDKTVKKVQVGTVSSSPGLEITLYQFNLISWPELETLIYGLG